MYAGAGGGGGGPPPQPAPPNQIDAVLSEVRRLEEVAHRNDEELSALSAVNGGGGARQQPHPHQEGVGGKGTDDDSIQSEISQLKARLAGTDQELQKTNSTLRWVGTWKRDGSFYPRMRSRNI